MSNLRYTFWWLGVITSICITATLFLIARLILLEKLSNYIYISLCKIMSFWTFLILKIKITDETETLSIKTTKTNMHQLRGYIVSVNHQSFADTALIMALLAKYNIYPKFVMKKEIIYYPFLNIFAYYLNFLPINRNKPLETFKMIQKNSQLKTFFHSWVIYPEGTRANIGYIKEPKAAGIIWLKKFFPELIWIDCTILYSTVINLYIKDANKKKKIEEELGEIWNFKIKKGLKYE